MRIFAVVIFVIFLAFLGYFYILGGLPAAQAPAAAPTETLTAVATITATTTTLATTSAHTYAWRFTELPDNEEGEPQTSVTLVVDGSSRNLGVFGGGCFVVEESAWQLLPSERSGVVCHFTGGGTELGVFEENGSTTVRKGVVDEGSADTPGTRDEFKTLFAL
jgi:hypothetical protein